MQTRIHRLLMFAVSAALFVNSTLADEPQAALSGRVTVKADEESFAGATAWIRLWEYDPRLADASAALFADVKLPKIEHTKGTATDITFALGDTDKVNPQRKYYVTIFVYRGESTDNVKDEIFFLDGFNRVDPPGEIKGTLKKLNR